MAGARRPTTFLHRPSGCRSGRLVGLRCGHSAGASNAAVTGDASTAREMASADQLISSSNAVDAGSNATDALTETKLLDAMQAVYTNGGTPSVMMSAKMTARLIQEDFAEELSQLQSQSNIAK